MLPLVWTHLLNSGKSSAVDVCLWLKNNDCFAASKEVEQKCKVPENLRHLQVHCKCMLTLKVSVNLTQIIIYL